MKFTNKKFNRALGIIGFIIGILSIIKNNFDFSYLQLVQIILIFISSYFFVILPIFNKNYIHKFPLFSLINLYFLIFYVGVFLFDKNLIFSNKFSISEYSYAINILFLGYLSFIIGYFIFNLSLKKFIRKDFKYFNCSANEILIMGTLILSLTFIIFYLIQFQKYYVSISQLKYPLLLFGSGLCLHYLITENKKNKIITIVLLILLILPILFEFLSGLSYFPFFMIFLFYIHYTTIVKKIYLTPFLILCLLFFLYNLGKHDYRSQVWDYNSNKELSFIDKSKIFVKSYTTKKSDDLKFKNIIKRTDNYRLERRIFHSFWSLLIVTKATPSDIPYWNGHSYRILFSKIVPRMFWKEKPSDILGNEFGHRYNILNKETTFTKKDTHTSWNMPVLNEFYINFGVKGVILGMLLIGAISSFLTKICSIKENKNIEGIIGFYICVPVFFLESHLSLLFGALIQSYIFLIFVSILFLYCLRKIK